MSGMEKMAKLNFGLGLVLWLGEYYLESRLEFLRPEVDALIAKMETEKELIEELAEEGESFF